MHALLAEKRFDGLPLVAMRFGFTLSRAYGSITQLVGNFDQGTLHTQTFATSAWGFGPVMQERLELFRRSGLTLRADLGEAALWYGHDFPSGGRPYNFMLQAGPMLSYMPSGSRFSVSVGYRWMHVSNGTGLGPRNPSYSAAGVALGVGFALHAAP